MRAFGAEIEPHPIIATERPRGFRRLALLSPLGQFGKDVALDDGRLCLAPVFPGEETIPGLERGAGRARSVVGGSRQREIADRCDMGIAGLRVPAAVAERIELLNIAKPQTRLFLDPGAQADLEGAVRDRIERTEREACELVALAA